MSTHELEIEDICYQEAAFTASKKKDHQKKLQPMAA